MHTRLSTILTSLTLLLPTLASAHEHQTFQIGDKQYSIGIGSLNEPVFVDDKTGVELEIQQLGGTAAHDTHEESDEHEEGTPVTGLEQTLKVEVQAGDKTKTLDFSPAWGEPGAYHAAFFPTVATTYTYRLKGTINGVNIDIPFVCNPAGHPATPDDTMHAEVGAVTRLSKSGAFGCPRPKAEMGFPEPSVTLHDVTASQNATAAWGGGILGLLGFVMGTMAFLKTRKSQV